MDTIPSSMTRQSVCCPRGSASVVNKSRSSSKDRIEGKKNIAHTRGSRPFARLHDDAINPRRWSRDPVYRLAPVPTERSRRSVHRDIHYAQFSPAKGLTTQCARNFHLATRFLPTTYPVNAVLSIRFATPGLLALANYFLLFFLLNADRYSSSSSFKYIEKRMYGRKFDEENWIQKSRQKKKKKTIAFFIDRVGFNDPILYVAHVEKLAAIMAHLSA